MKKLVSWILIAALLGAILVACGAAEPTEAPAPTEAPQAEPTVAEEEAVIGEETVAAEETAAKEEISEVEEHIEKEPDSVIKEAEIGSAALEILERINQENPLFETSMNRYCFEDTSIVALTTASINPQPLVRILI